MENQNNKLKILFELISEYLNDINDLSSLHIAIGPKYQHHLYYSWMKFLKSNPLITIQLDQKYIKEKEYLYDLYKIQLKKMTSINNEYISNPYDFLIKTLNECKYNIDLFVNKVRGPVPEMYTDEFEEWEGYNSYVHGYDKAVLYEAFWKDGGREGEAISKKYVEWENAETDIKNRWLQIFDDTINVINNGNDELQKILLGDNKTKIGRKIILHNELKKKGLQLRNDSLLCNNFIEYNIGNLSNIVNTMVEMDFLYNKTNYRSMIYNQKNNINYEHEEIKIHAIKQFIRDNSNKINGIPYTLLNKIKEYDKKINFEKYIYQQLLYFKNDNENTILEFSTELTNKERYLVHRYSEKLKLIHNSIGYGKERRIIVKK